MTTRREAEELAALLADDALSILHRAGLRGVSVEVELEAWKALGRGLNREGARERPLGSRPDAGAFLAGVVHRAVLEVAAVFAPDADPVEVESRVRPLVAEVRFPSATRLAANRLLEPRDAEWSRPLGPSGLFRTLRVVALDARRGSQRPRPAPAVGRNPYAARGRRDVG